MSLELVVVMKERGLLEMMVLDGKYGEYGERKEEGSMERCAKNGFVIKEMAADQRQPSEKIATSEKRGEGGTKAVLNANVTTAMGEEDQLCQRRPKLTAEMPEAQSHKTVAEREAETKREWDPAEKKLHKRTLGKKKKKIEKRGAK